MRHLIEITAADVEAAGLAVDVVLPAAWITKQGEDAEAQASSDGHLVGRISRSGRADMVVRGVVTCTVEVPCARCLKLTPIEVRGELSLLLKPNPALKPSPVVTKKATAKAKADAKVEAAEAARAALRRDDPRASKSDKGKAPRLPEYEFSSEEADHDEYDGDTVVLDPFVREAILLELPNFPLCSESCAGISAGLSASRADALGNGGAGSSRGNAAPFKANPFEALKHLAQGLPPGPKSSEGGEASETNGVNGKSEHHWSSTESPETSNKKPRNEAKLASSHSAPSRRGASKKAAQRGRVAPKKSTKN